MTHLTAHSLVLMSCTTFKANFLASLCKYILFYVKKRVSKIVIFSVWIFPTFLIVICLCLRTFLQTLKDSATLKKFCLHCYFRIYIRRALLGKGTICQHSGIPLLTKKKNRIWCKYENKINFFFTWHSCILTIVSVTSYFREIYSKKQTSNWAWIKHFFTMKKIFSI